MQRSYRRGLTLSRPIRTRALACALIIPVALSGCSVSAPLEVTSSGAGIAPGTAVALAETETPETLRARFQSALARAFEKASSEMSENAPVFAEFSVAMADASEGIVSGKGGKIEGTQEPDWLSQPRRKRNLDECKAKRVRAGLVLYDRATGDIVYRGSGQATECDFSDEDIAAIAEALVEDAVARERD